MTTIGMVTLWIIIPIAIVWALVDAFVKTIKNRGKKND